MRTGFANVEVAIDFPLIDDLNSPISCVLDGAWTKTLRANGASSAITVTVTEIGSTGRYTVDYTPDAAGFWYLDLYHAASGARFKGEVEVSLDAEANVSMVDSAGTIRVTSWLTRNGRQVLDATNSVVTIYDDAGSQLAQVTDTSDDAQSFFFATASLSVTDNRTFPVTVAITDPLGVVTTTHASISVATS